MKGLRFRGGLRYTVHLALALLFVSSSARANRHAKLECVQEGRGDSVADEEEAQDREDPEGRTLKPLVISSNPKLEVKLSGRIHRMIQFTSDGSSGGADAFFTDSLQGPTILRVDVAGKASDTLTVGGALELGLQQNSPVFVSQDNADAGFNVTGRVAELYLMQR